MQGMSSPQRPGDGRGPLSVFLITMGALLLLPVSGAARDRGADGRFSQRESSHFVLYQDVDIDRYHGPSGSRRFEREVLEILEVAYGKTGDVLGIRPRREIQVVIYDPAVFEQRFQGLFRFSAAGFFNGAIHVRGNTRVDARLVRTLHHEYLHAALDEAAPGYAFPGWVNEGLAEWFENRAIGKRYLSHGEHAYLAEASRRGELMPLSSLVSPGFGRLDSARASVAYLRSYAAIDYLAARHGERSLKAFCDQLIRTRDLDRALRRAFRTDLARLEAELARELR
jgi:hypothetical protein